MANSGTDGELVISVVRTGGFAGLRREWRAMGTSTDWSPTLDACPWGRTPGGAHTGVDRFAWRIEVTGGARLLAVALSDDALTGPWRELVDRVQAASGSAGS